MKRSITKVLFAAITLFAATNYSCLKDEEGNRYYFEGVRITISKFNPIANSFPGFSTASPDQFEEVKTEWLQYKQNADEIIYKGRYVSKDDIIEYLATRSVPLSNAQKIISWIDARGNIIMSDTDDNDSKFKIVLYYEKVKR